HVSRETFSFGTQPAGDAVDASGSLEPVRPDLVSALHRMSHVELLLVARLDFSKSEGGLLPMDHPEPRNVAAPQTFPSFAASPHRWASPPAFELGLCLGSICHVGTGTRAVRSNAGG